MSYRPFVLAAATAALLSMDVASTAAQPAYLASGAIYVGGSPPPVYGPGYGYGCGGGALDVHGYDDGYGISAHEGYGDECEPGPYGAPGYGYGPAPRYRFGYGPGPRYGYGYGPPPRFDYGYGPAPRSGNGYGPAPRVDYGYGPALRHGNGYGPAPRLDNGYGLGPAGRYGSGSNQPRRPARTAAPAPKSDAAEPPGGSRAPAPFAGQR